ncbi:MAG TPA: hypothetical protein VFV93_15630 [Thermomicrobiales bacterium]|nr:hypothetical protein [Thermomicrobiales bacterium]
MPRLPRNRGRSRRRGRRDPFDRSIIPIYPSLRPIGFFAGVMTRWLMRPSRLGISRGLLGLIVVVVLIWLVVLWS